MNIKFDDYLQTEDFKNAVDRLPYTQGNTGIDKALDVAVTQLLVTKSGARSGLTKILVVMTASAQNQTVDNNLLERVAKKLRQLGVAVFIMGVGDQVDETLLRSLVTAEENLFLETSFESLMLKSRQVAKMTCDNAGMFIQLLKLTEGPRTEVVPDGLRNHH